MRKFDPDSHLDTAAAAVQLDIDPAYRKGVTQFLQIAVDMAEALDDAELDFDVYEPAAVFTLPGDEGAR